MTYGNTETLVPRNRIGGFLFIVLVIQVLVWILVGLEIVGINVPLINPIVGFVYLTFVPGLLILGLLKIRSESLVETSAFSVGISLSLLMIVGFLLNLVGPLAGLDKPLSVLPLVVTLSIIVLCLSAITWSRNIDFASNYLDSIRVYFSRQSSPSFYFLWLLPAVGIFGSIIVNYQDNNIGLLVLIGLICLTVLLVCFRSLFPAGLYPVAIFCISLALLYHSVLISNYLTGWDVHLEYYFAQLTANNSHWDSSVSFLYNSNISVTILPVIYFNFMNIDILWIYKLVYPLLYSIVPLVLYTIFKKQVSPLSAFIAVSFFMMLDVFFDVMGSLMKQQIAEIFFSLLILLMLSHEMNRSKRTTLTILFSFSLVVSHYATSYIYLFYAVLAWVFIYILSLIRKSQVTSIVTGGLVLFFAVMVIAWYMYAASSATFTEIVNIGSYMYINLSDFLIGGSRELTILRLLGLSQPAHIVGANVYRVTQLIIIIGVVVTAIRYRQLKIQMEYTVMTFLSLLLLGLCLILPYFAEFLHVDRFYHITLFFLAPFFVIGGQFLFKWPVKLFYMVRNSLSRKPGLFERDETHGVSSGSAVTLRLLVIIVLLPYFLFTSGFIYEVTQDKVPTSIALSRSKFENTDVLEAMEQYYSGYSYEANVYSARWLSRYKLIEYDICCDRLSATWILPSYGLISYAYPIDADTEIPENSYVYLSRFNVLRGLMDASSMTKKYGSYYTFTYPTDHISRLLNNRIYTNGESEVYQFR